MKGKNILWGTALYLTTVLALYNRKPVALTEDEALRSSNRDPGTWRAEKVRAAKSAGETVEAKFEKEYLAKKWAR